MMRISILPLWFRQAFVYGMVGSTSMVADFVFYAALTRLFGIHYLLANTLSFISIGSLNFLANRHFTFRHRGRPTLRQYTKFFTIAGVGLVLNTALLALFVQGLGIYDLLAKLFAAGIVFFWNFGMNRYWTFRHPTDVIPITPL